MDYGASIFPVAVSLFESASLQVVLRSLMFESDESLGGGQYVYNYLKMAVMVLGMLLVLIIYPFVQRHFVSGLMLGGVKG